MPRTHHYYEPGLWLAHLIATKAGVAMEQVGRAQFESVIIDVSDVFEKYVLKLLQEASASHFHGCTVLDGNRRGVPLFTTSDQFTTQPDYYFRRAGVNCAVADGKYKPSVKTEDRYALLAFAEALNVKKAAFACPLFTDEPMAIHQGTTQGGVEVHVLRIDLSAADLSAEELLFKSRMAAALGL